MSTQNGQKGTDMNGVYRKHTDYFSKAFRDLDELAEKMLETVKDVNFDTMVGTGLSGTLVVPHLARTFGTYWAIIRKDEQNHDYGKVVGEIGQRWLFVDDFVSMGHTLRRVRNAIDELKVDEYDEHGRYSQT